MARISSKKCMVPYLKRHYRINMSTKKIVLLLIMDFFLEFYLRMSPKIIPYFSCMSKDILSNFYRVPKLLTNLKGRLRDRDAHHLRVLHPENRAGFHQLDSRHIPHNHLLGEGVQRGLLWVFELLGDSQELRSCSLPDLAVLPRFQQCPLKLKKIN